MIALAAAVADKSKPVYLSFESMAAEFQSLLCFPIAAVA
jgi:hypothetical protein